MKAITLHQPWASLVARGYKTIETRSWPTHHRGPIAIHAAKRPWSRRNFGDHVVIDETLPLGAVVATANLVDCIPMVEVDDYPSDVERWLEIDPVGLDGLPELALWNWPDTATGPAYEANVDKQEPFGDFAPGRWAWLLADVVPEPRPAPVRGRQGLWNWERT